MPARRNLQRHSGAQNGEKSAKYRIPNYILVCQTCILFGILAVWRRKLKILDVLKVGVRLEYKPYGKAESPDERTKTSFY
jgi:hypothetical protein